MKPKRLISLLVAVCMMITMLPLSAVTAFAADTATVHTASVGGYKYEYKVNGGNATITKFLGPDASTKSTGSYDIEIPTTLGGYTVTAIGDYAFLDCHTLDNVTIPPSVTSIGKSAFYRCYALTTLSLGENIEKIGSYAFAECRHLTNVTIPEKVETIEPYTFGWCLDLKYITLPAGLTSFKDRLVSCPAGFTKQSPKNGVSSHKIHGPKGSGAIYVREGVNVRPLCFGGSQESKVRPGTENVPGIAAFGHASLKALRDIRENWEHVKELNLYLTDCLRQMEDVVINSPSGAVPYVLNISVLPLATEELLHEMRMRGIYLSGSSACEKGARSHVIRAMGIEGPRADSVVRIGLGKKNTREEVTVLVETLNELIKRGK